MIKAVAITIISLCSLLSIQAFGQEETIKADEINICKKANENFANYKFTAALELLEICFESDTSNMTCLSKIAQCHYQLGALKEAKKSYSQILTVDAGNISALNQLANIHSKEAQYDKSIENYEKLVQLDSTNSYYYKKIGSIALKIGEFQHSINCYQMARSLNSKDITVLIALANIYQQMEQFELADALIDEGLGIDSSNLTLLRLSASNAYKQKDYSKVVESINNSLSHRNDTTTNFLKLLGVSYFHLEKLEPSIECLTKVLVDKPDSEIINYYLGLAYRAQGKMDKSVFHLENAIKNGISDNISTYYTNLAITCEENNNYEESIRAYQAAYKSSQDKLLLYHLARNYDVYYKNKETALLYYQRYLVANDSNNVDFNDYSKHRITEIKSIKHFELDTLN